MHQMEPKRKTTGLKVISILIAVLLWFYVMNQGQLAARQNILAVDLNYINLAEGMSIEGPATVSVKLWGVFQETSDIRAYVDMNGLDEGAYRLPVHIDPVQGAMFTSVQPDQVEVVVRQTRQHVLPVSSEIVQNPPVGGEVLDLVISPNKCLVTGEEAAVTRVSTVICQVDLSKVTEPTTITAPLIARDVNGNLVSEGIRLVPDKVQVVAVVQQPKASSSFAITPNIAGSVGDGYEVGQVIVDPATITLVGSETLLQGINEIQTDPINLEGRKESFVETVKITLPEGLQGYPEQVKVTVEILKKSEREEPSS